MLGFVWFTGSCPEVGIVMILETNSGFYLELSPNGQPAGARQRVSLCRRKHSAGSSVSMEDWQGIIHLFDF